MESSSFSNLGMKSARQNELAKIAARRLVVAAREARRDRDHIRVGVGRVVRTRTGGVRELRLSATVIMSPAPLIALIGTMMTVTAEIEGAEGSDRISSLDVQIFNIRVHGSIGHFNHEETVKT